MQKEAIGTVKRKCAMIKLLNHLNAPILSIDAMRFKEWYCISCWLFPQFHDQVYINGGYDDQAICSMLTFPSSFTNNMIIVKQETMIFINFNLTGTSCTNYIYSEKNSQLQDKTWFNLYLESVCTYSLQWKIGYAQN